MPGLVSLIVVALLAIGFGVAILVRARGSSNQGGALGNNSPWPDTVFVPPPGHYPPLGSTESLESHPSHDWVDAEMRREKRRRRARRD